MNILKRLKSNKLFKAALLVAIGAFLFSVAGFNLAGEKSRNNAGQAKEGAILTAVRVDDLLSPSQIAPLRQVALRERADSKRRKPYISPRRLEKLAIAMMDILERQESAEWQKGGVSIGNTLGTFSFADEITLTVFPDSDERQKCPHLALLDEPVRARVQGDGWFPEEGSFGKIILQFIIVDGEPALLIKEIQASVGYLTFRTQKAGVPDDVKEIYREWPEAAISLCMELASKYLGITKFYGTTHRSISEDYHLRDGIKKEYYRRPYRDMGIWDIVDVVAYLDERRNSYERELWHTVLQEAPISIAKPRPVPSRASVDGIARGVLRQLARNEREREVALRRQERLKRRYIGQKNFFISNKISFLMEDLEHAGWQYPEIVACALTAISTFAADEIHPRYREEFFSIYNFRLEDDRAVGSDNFVAWSQMPDLNERLEAILAFLQVQGITVRHTAQEVSSRITHALEVHNLTAEAKEQRRRHLAKRYEITLREMDGALERKRRRLVGIFGKDVILLPQPLAYEGGTLIYVSTYRCSISCRHCLFIRQGMEKRGHIREVFNALTDWALINKLTDVSEGNSGEVFGDPESKEDLLYTLRNSKLPVLVATNGFWANSEQDVRNMFDELMQALSENPHLSAHKAPPLEIKISLDDFHQEVQADNETGLLRAQIPIKNIANVIKVASEGKFPRIMVGINTQRTPNTERLIAELEHELGELGCEMIPWPAVHPFTGERLPIANVKIKRPDGEVAFDTLGDDYFVRQKSSEHAALFSIDKNFIRRAGWAELLEDFEYVHSAEASDSFESLLDKRIQGFISDNVIVTADGNVFLGSCVFERRWSLGNIYEEGIDAISLRSMSDFLIWAHARACPLLFEFAQEVEPDIIEKLRRSKFDTQSAVARLFESSAMRLYLTERLMHIYARGKDHSLFKKTGLPENLDELKAEYYRNQASTGQNYDEMPKTVSGAVGYVVGVVGDGSAVKPRPVPSKAAVDVTIGSVLRQLAWEERRTKVLKIWGHEIEIPPGYYVIDASARARAERGVMDEANFDVHRLHLIGQVLEARKRGLIPLLATDAHHPSLSLAKALKDIDGACPQIVSSDTHIDTYMAWPMAYTRNTFWRYGIQEKIINGSDLILALPDSIYEEIFTFLDTIGISMERLRQAVEDIPIEAFNHIQDLRKHSKYMKQLPSMSHSDRKLLHDIAYIAKVGIRLCRAVVDEKLLSHEKGVFPSMDLDAELNDEEWDANAEILSKHKIVAVHLTEIPPHEFNPHAVTEFLKKIVAGQEILGGPAAKPRPVPSKVLADEIISRVLRQVAREERPAYSFDEVKKASADRQCKMLSSLKLQVIARETHSIILSNPGLDYVIKIRNVEGDINGSFFHYANYEDSQPDMMAEYFVVKGGVVLKTMTNLSYACANVVVQEKVDILTDLIDSDIEQGEIDRAEARLGGFLGVHCALARDGLIDKLFTIGPQHSKRKYLTNIGVSRRTGRYVHIDRADLIAYTPSVSLNPAGLNNVQDWFPYQDNPRLSKYLQANIIPLLQDVVYDRGKIKGLLQAIRVLEGVRAAEAPRAIAQCIRGSLEQARVTGEHFKEILVVFDYDDQGDLSSIAVAPRATEGHLPGGLSHDRLWLEAGRSPKEGFIRLDIFFDTETGKPADLTMLPNVSKYNALFQSQGAQIVSLVASILHYLGCSSEDMESIRSHQIEKMLGRGDHGQISSFADVLRVLSIPFRPIQSLNEAADNAALAAI